MTSQFPGPDTTSTYVATLVPPRTVDAGRGVAWWGEAWRIFTPAVGVWLLTLLVLFVLNVVLTFIPVLGHIAGQVLFPAIVAGIMLGCRAIDQGQPMTLHHMFSGFSARGGPLLVLGLIYTALLILIAVIVFGLLFALFGAAIIDQLWHAQDSMPMSAALGKLLFALLVGVLVFLLLYLPLVMAIWFAPALVVFHNVDPWPAMKQSFSGCMINMLPFLLYGLIGVALAIAASIPLMLGWILLVPVSLASLYTSYCDIYEDRTAAPSASPATA
jgi:uncharacterized membrane protein